MQNIHINLDGTVLTTELSSAPTSVELKADGKQFLLNGINYQIPLDESGQNGVNSVAIMIIMNLFTPTIFNCSNDVKVPLADVNEATTFCKWFANERGKFFK